MATDVLTWTLLGQYANGSLKQTIPSEIMSFDQTTQRVWENTQLIGSGAEEDIVLPSDITTPGWCFMRNLDATNYVTWGPKSGGVMIPVGRLEAADVGSGDFAVFRLDPTGPATLRMQANTADVLVHIIIWAS